jgi:hypothetical protein
MMRRRVTENKEAAAGYFFVCKKTALRYISGIVILPIKLDSRKSGLRKREPTGGKRRKGQALGA